MEEIEVVANDNDRFQRIEQRFSQVEQRFTNVDGELVLLRREDCNGRGRRHTQRKEGKVWP